MSSHPNEDFTLGLPPQQGLYDPRNEHDNCGMGFIVNLNGDRSTRSLKKV